MLTSDQEGPEEHPNVIKGAAEGKRKLAIKDIIRRVGSSRKEQDLIQVIKRLGDRPRSDLGTLEGLDENWCDKILGREAHSYRLLIERNRISLKSYFVEEKEGARDEAQEK